MATEGRRTWADTALAELMRELTPLVAQTAPGPEGWPQEYRRRDGATDVGSYRLDDPAFALRVVIENPSRFGSPNPQALSNAARHTLHHARMLPVGDAATTREFLGRAGDLLDLLGRPEAVERCARLAEQQPEAAPEGDGPADAAMPAVMRRWKGRLLDLSRANPLLAVSRHGVPLLVDESTLPDIEDVVADGVPIVVRGSEDLDELELPEWARHATDLDSATVLRLLSDEGIVFAREETRALSTDLPKLRRRAHVAREESGASPLYLTLGGLQIMDDIAPLFLLPVTLSGGRRGPWSVQLEPQADLRFNECLVEWLRRTCDFEPEVLRRPPTDHSGIDMPRVFVGLRAAMAARRLPFEVVVDARLALLEFSTMEMWRDLDDHWEALSENSVVAHLVAATDAPYRDAVPEPVSSDADECALTLPLPADGSQMKAVRWAGAGRSFVLQGPPGTGKSQTIANIVADAVANGRRVLFVAEKEAAVDVVARRLRAVGLAQRCLDLRSKDQTTRGVRTHLTKALARTGAPSAQMQERRARHRELVGLLSGHPRALREHPDVVASLDGDLRRRQVEAYRNVTRELRQDVRAAAPHGPEVSTRGHEWRAEDEMSALRRELRIARVEGIRDLVEAHTDAILALTPCLLMSPATVARYLPARAGLFDLVVFDEASQIKVPDAIGAMGRARGVVIVGDPQQMPPSDLFAAEVGHDAEDDAEQESILREAVRIGLPILPLTWHYRSRSEGLVAFSNGRYYEGALASFPTPPGSRRDSGVEFRRVNGRYEAGRSKRRRNLIEANAVVDEVHRLVAENPDMSLGVVTFNDAQRDDILDKLEADTAPAPVRAALRRDVEPLFVKNLEHVQGDERDHILFSLTYACGEDGRLPMNFGRLTRAGGERRLNVAITRARVRNTLFCSFDPSDIDRSSRVSLGPSHLRDYLLAALQASALPGPNPRPESEDLCVGLVDQLRDAGLEVVADVGLSNFRVDHAVRAPGRPWIAVQLDHREWAQRAAVADRDDIPYSVLQEHMGWADVHQLYRCEWERDPLGVVGRIRVLAEMAGGPFSAVGTTASSGGAAVPQALIAAVADAQAAVVRPLAGLGTYGVSPFIPAEDDVRRDRAVLGRLPEPEAVAEVGEEWRDVVAAEGPILLDRAAYVVAHRFGWRRLHEGRREALYDSIPADVRRTNADGYTYLWPEHLDPAAYRGIRGGPRADRKIHEIAPEERANAIRLVLAESGGRCDADDLVRGVKEVFGFGKLGPVLRAGIEAVIDGMVDRGDLLRGSDGVCTRQPPVEASCGSSAGI